jgi:hypothetical protein
LKRGCVVPFLVKCSPPPKRALLAADDGGLLAAREVGVEALVERGVEGEGLLERGGALREGRAGQQQGGEE